MRTTTIYMLYSEVVPNPVNGSTRNPQTDGSVDPTTQAKPRGISIKPSYICTCQLQRKKPIWFKATRLDILKYLIFTRKVRKRRSKKLGDKNAKKSSDPGSNQGPQDNKFLAEQGNYSLALFQLSYQRRLLECCRILEIISQITSQPAFEV